MKLLSKINTPAKIVLLVVYTLILASCAVLIINIASVKDEKEGYGIVARDENIQILTKTAETRTHSTTSSNENANWTLYFQVLQHNKEVEVTDIEIFAKAKTVTGKTIYFEETKAYSTSNYKGLPCKSSSSFKSFSSDFRKSISSSGELSDNEMEKVYVQVIYNATKDGNTEKKSFKYYYNLTKVDKENYNDMFETIQLTENDKYQDVSSEEFGYYSGQLRFKRNEKRSSTSSIYDVFYSKFSFDEGKIREEGKQVVDTSITIIGKIQNDVKDTNNVFSDYIKLLELHGLPLDVSGNEYYTSSEKNNISLFNGSSLSVNTLYELSEAYMLVSVTTSDGVTNYNRVKINLPEA